MTNFKNLKNLHLKTAVEIAELVNSRQIKATEIAEYFLDRAEKINPKLNAFNSITRELAIKQAQETDKKLSQDKNLKLALAGVPIAVKDNLCVLGTKTTCSSKILENFVSPYNSTVMEKINSEDMII